MCHPTQGVVPFGHLPWAWCRCPVGACLCVSLRESKIISHQPCIYIFTSNGKRSERPLSSQPRASERMWATPWVPIPRTLRPKRAKARNHIAYSYRFCPFRAPSGVSSHPGCRSLRSLALGLVLLPRWGVSLRLCVRSKIISVNFPSGWSESKANRYSVCSVISVCNLNTRRYSCTWKIQSTWLNRWNSST